MVWLKTLQYALTSKQEISSTVLPEAEAPAVADDATPAVPAMSPAARTALATLTPFDFIALIGFLSDI
jgi:hypothetical protein